MTLINKPEECGNVAKLNERSGARLYENSGIALSGDKKTEPKSRFLAFKGGAFFQLVLLIPPALAVGGSVAVRP